MLIEYNCNAGMSSVNNDSYSNIYQFLLYFRSHSHRHARNPIDMYSHRFRSEQREHAASCAKGIPEISLRSHTAPSLFRESHLQYTVLIRSITLQVNVGRQTYFEVQGTECRWLASSISELFPDRAWLLAQDQEVAVSNSQVKVIEFHAWHLGGHNYVCVVIEDVCLRVPLGEDVRASDSMCSAA